MFDFSFAELLIIGVVALIVIGPERMPKVARTMGLLFGRAQRYVSEVKADISNQLKLEELRKIEAEMRAKASTAEYEIIEETRYIEKELKGVVEQVAPVISPSAIEEEGAVAHTDELSSTSATETPSTASPQLELGLDLARSHPAETTSK